MLQSHSKKCKFMFVILNKKHLRLSFQCPSCGTVNLLKMYTILKIQDDTQLSRQSTNSLPWLRVVTLKLIITDHKLHFINRKKASVEPGMRLAVLVVKL